jgi:hypothetical protein
MGTDEAGRRAERTRRRQEAVSAHATLQDGRGDQHGEEDGQGWEEEGHEETVGYFSCEKKGAAVAPFCFFYCQPFPSQMRTR